MRVLAFAYACEPDRGSEPGAGWAWARIIASFGEATVITRANNREAIEAALPVTPERDRLHFVYVDLPPWSRFWKRGQRGIHLYYALWQLAALRVARQLHRSQRFDVVWHVTMTNAWMGSTAPLVGAPFIYGPIGGGVRTPRRLIVSLAPRGMAREAVYAVLQTASRFVNPFVRLAARRASLILVQNPETREWLPSAYRDKTVVFPNSVVASPERAHIRQEDSRVALFAGRLVPGKAVSLAVRAMVDLPDWQLVICGAGPEERRLRRLARTLRIEKRVLFTGWVPRRELTRIMVDEADVFLFPSLHEGSPWAVHEARAAGLPVVCIEGCGSTTLATVIVQVGWPRGTARALARGVLQARSAPSPPPGVFDMATRREGLAAVLHDAGFPVAMVDLQDSPP